jgi:hypothetical protein
MTAVWIDDEYDPVEIKEFVEPSIARRLSHCSPSYHLMISSARIAVRRASASAASSFPAVAPQSHATPSL